MFITEMIYSRNELATEDRRGYYTAENKKRRHWTSIR